MMIWINCIWPDDIIQNGHGDVITSLQWRHNGRDNISNHQPHDCFLSRLCRQRSKKTSKLCITGLCAGNSPEAREFRTQMASNVENVSIWWCHHDWSQVTHARTRMPWHTWHCTHRTHLHTLTQIMGCLLYGNKPFSKPVLAYCKLDTYEQIWVNFESKSQHFHTRVWI